MDMPSARLFAYVAGLTVCLAFALAPENSRTRADVSGTLRDVDVFERIVNQVRACESFHDATQRELRAHGYPTRSPFNWRTPTYAWWLASPIGAALGRWGLVLGMVGACGIAGRNMLEEQGLVGGGVGVVFLVGSMAWCFGDKAWYHTELWAATLIILSILAYHGRRWPMAVALGVLALFFRELALPYCLACLALATRARRWPELRAWLIGLGIYGLFFAWHSACVAVRITEADIAFAEGWLRFGGISFVLQTARANIFLASMPLWCAGVYLPTALFGMTADRTEEGCRLRLAAWAYVVGLCVIGHPINFYWGWIYAPMLALGVAQAPRALTQAIREVSGARFETWRIGTGAWRG